MTEYSAEITKLLAEGAKSYAAKNYDVAVDHYGEACQLFSENHDGEEDPELLFLYGQALFQAAVSKNGLFGGSAEETTKGDAGEEEEKKEEEKPTNGMFTFSEDVPLAEEDDSSSDEDDAEGEQDDDEDNDGDDDDNNDDEGDANGDDDGAPQEEEQSDFEVAWEILDLARTLFESKIPEGTHEIPENASESTDSTIKNKVKLSEIYDLLGEISLETENFKQAAEDFESLLKVRETIYPFESNMVSEAHYKLALALDFDFENDEAKSKAVHHLKKAIQSIKDNQTKLGTNKDDDLIKDLEIKLQEMEKDPNEAFNQQKADIMKGILGQATGSNSDAIKSSASASPAPVNNLTGLVKKRKAKPTDDSVKKAKN